MTHPDEDTWVRLACDELTVEERDRIVDHALGCDACAAALRAVTYVRRNAADIDARAPRPAVRSVRSYTYLWLGLAAALVLAIGGAFVLRSERGLRSSGDSLASTSSPGPAPAPAPSGPRAWARLDQVPDVRLPADLVLATRGKDRDREALEAFGKAMAHFRDSRFAVAAEQLTALTAVRQDVPEFAFYLGAARLFNEDPAEAVPALRQARTSGVVGSDAQWYEAVALERLGRAAQADAVLRELCATSNPYQTRACAALKGGS